MVIAALPAALVLQEENGLAAADRTGDLTIWPPAGDHVCQGVVRVGKEGDGFLKGPGVRLGALFLLGHGRVIAMCCWLVRYNCCRQLVPVVVPVGRRKWPKMAYRDGIHGGVGSAGKSSRKSLILIVFRPPVSGSFKQRVVGSNPTRLIFRCGSRFAPLFVTVISGGAVLSRGSFPCVC